MQPLGTLQRVDLRDIWRSEASDFTPWLARAENLSILGDALGIELELEAQEKDVGPFRADILCKDVDTDHWVLIENQLERTDHSHLGQLLTYAAGLDAVVIVWIAARFTDEHRAALDWLNETTDERCRFFGLEVELWRISDSPAAPKFNIISKPNDWSRSVGRAAKSIADEPLTELKAQQLKYWQAFNAHLEERHPRIRTRKPRPQHWTTFAAGRSGMHLGAKVNTSTRRIGAELFIRANDAKALFAQLLTKKTEIESAVGEPLSWEDLPDRVGCRIALYRDNSDPTDEADWPSQHLWLGDALGRLDRAFRPHLRDLEATDDEAGTAEIA